MKYIDVSGVGNSGKSAVVDLLREIDEIYVPDFQFEFDLIRTKNGLLDLRASIVDDWSPVRSDIALKLFIKKAYRMGINPSYINFFGLLNSLSTRYERYFNKKFLFHTKNFTDSLIVSSYKALWPFEEDLENKLILFFKKILSRLGFKGPRMREVNIIATNDFDKKAKEYLDNLYLEIVKKEQDYVVLNNSIEPFNPLRGLKILGPESKQIIVLRDPRDIFISGRSKKEVKRSGLGYELIAFDNDGTNKSFLGTQNINSFINRQKIFLEKSFSENTDNIFIVWFEDLVLAYEKTSKDIFNFLEIKHDSHLRKKEFFNPDKSKENIFLWKKYGDSSEIKQIERDLNEFLYKEDSLGKR